MFTAVSVAAARIVGALSGFMARDSGIVFGCRDRVNVIGRLRAAYTDYY